MNFIFDFLPISVARSVVNGRLLTLDRPSGIKQVLFVNTVIVFVFRFSKTLAGASGAIEDTWALLSNSSYMKQIKNPMEARGAKFVVKMTWNRSTK